MLHYPYALYDRHIRLSPLFDNLKGDPLQIDLSTGNHLLEQIDVRDQKNLQSLLEGQMAVGSNWGLGGYLERRDTLLRDCPQMVVDERYYHLGVDIMVPVNSVLHAPLDAVVSQAGYEEGEGNYGGFHSSEARRSGLRSLLQLLRSLESGIAAARGHPSQSR